MRLRQIARTVAIGALGFALLGAPAAAQSARQLYERAREAETRLRGSQERASDPAAWTSVGRAYRAVVLSWPRSGYCDDALWYAGGVYRDAAERFQDRSFAVRGVDAYRLLSRGYPASKWVPKALYQQVRLSAGRLGDRAGAERALAELRRRAPRGPEARMAAAVLAPAEPEVVATPARERAAAPAVIRNIRHWVGESHTRVVIDMSGRTGSTEGRLSNPERVYFDLQGAELAEDLATREFPIEGSHLRRIRLGAHDEGVVRVVLDFSSVREVTSFWLPDPYRLVVDIHGAPRTVVAEAEPQPPEVSDPESSDEAPEAAAPAADEPAAARPTTSGYSLARQLGLRVKKIVVDPGHGGQDPGTRAGSLLEKDITLDIGMRVRKLLEERGFDVVMTRETDVFIPLEQRAFLANDAGADLFVSIHVNAARNRSARGLETFYLNLATSPEAAEVAARENASNQEIRVSELQDLLPRILNHERKEESRAFAEAMQGALTEEILGHEEHPHNRGVKTAGFHVLLGARMAAILVEAGFVSNREEARLLRRDDHREKLAAAIAEGVARYAGELGQEPTATADRSSPGE